MKADVGPPPADPEPGPPAPPLPLLQEPPCGPFPLPPLPAPFMLKSEGGERSEGEGCCEVGTEWWLEGCDMIE